MMLVVLNASSWRCEATRLYLRYAQEVVEQFNLCPWAQRARTDGRTKIHVYLDDVLEIGSVARFVQQAFMESSIEVFLLLFPRIEADFLAWQSQANHLRSRLQLERIDVALAPFHPQGPRREGNAFQLVELIRRTPDCTFQLVRMDVLRNVRSREHKDTSFFELERVAALQPSKAPQAALHERVAEANFSKLAEFGVDAFERLLLEIRDDRDRTYMKLRDE